MRRRGCLLALLALVGGCTVPSSGSEGEPTLLRVVMADDWASAPVVNDVVTDFEEEHDVRVELQGAAFSQIPDLVESSLELEQPYDLAHWHAFAAAAAGLAQPVDGAWERHGLTAEEYLPGALESVTWRGRRHGVPLDTNAMVLMARPALLEEAGVELDELGRVEAFLDVSRRVVDQEAATHAMLIGASSWTAYGWIRAHGGELVDVDPESGEPTFSFEDPRAVAALDLRARLVEEGLAPSPFAPDLASEAVQLFAHGEVALHAGGSWDLPLLSRAGVSPEEVEVLPLPDGPGDAGTVLGGSSLFVPPDAEQRDLAFELALALTEDEVALRLAEEEGRLPARERVLEDELFQRSPGLETVVDQLPEAEVMPLIAYPEVAEAFREALESILAGRQEAGEAMAEVQRFAESWSERQR